jgi:hypothetical protein
MTALGVKHVIQGADETLLAINIQKIDYIGVYGAINLPFSV